MAQNNPQLGLNNTHWLTTDWQLDLLYFSIVFLLCSSSHNSQRGIHSTHPVGASFIYNEQYSGSLSKQMENTSEIEVVYVLC